MRNCLSCRNRYFFLPTYATLLAAISFDQTGTTRIGKYILNHSFMIPGMVATVVSGDRILDWKDCPLNQ